MCSPDSPDTAKADANAAKMAQLNEDQFNWVKGQWEADAPTRAAAARRAGEVSDEQLRQMKSAGALADESAADYRRIYRPLEEAQAKEAENFNTEARRDQAAGEAVTGVEQAFSGQRDAQERNMASMGINVSDGAYGSNEAQMRAAQAVSSAGAATRARQQVETMGRALRADAIGVGRGVIGSQGTQAGLALNAGNASVGTAQAPLGVTAQGVGMVQQAANSATNGLGAAGNIYTRTADLQQQANASASSGTGALIGAGMTAAAIF